MKLDDSRQSYCKNYLAYFFWPTLYIQAIERLWLVVVAMTCCRYAGELISDAEADRREVDTYLFDLDNQVSHCFVDGDGSISIQLVNKHWHRIYNILYILCLSYQKMADIIFIIKHLLYLKYFIAFIIATKVY